MTSCVLVGIPGSGKSSIGRELAKQLNVNFIDTDREIERVSNKSVSEIFIDDGEEYFRNLEKIEVLKALSNLQAVVSLGGGSVLNDEVRNELKNHNTIWLETSIPVALKRTSLNQNRPLLIEAPRATLIKLLEERSGFYEEVSRFKISTDNRAIKAIVDEIILKIKVGST